LAPNSP